MHLLSERQGPQAGGGSRGGGSSGAASGGGGGGGGRGSGGDACQGEYIYIYIYIYISTRVWYPWLATVHRSMLSLTA